MGDVEEQTIADATPIGTFVSNGWGVIANWHKR